MNTGKALTKTPVVCLLAGICCLLWGSAFPFIKIGYRLLDIPSGDISSQLLFAGFRFTLAGVFTIIISSFVRGRLLIPQKTALPKILKISMVQTVFQYVLFYIGLAHTTGVNASIIGGTNVFFTLLAAAFVFRSEKLTAGKIFGCIIGFAGILLINLSGIKTSGGSFHFLGEGAIILSTISYAFSSGLIKQYAKEEDPLMLSGYQFLLGGIILIGAGTAGKGTIAAFTPKSVLLLIYLAFVSAIAYSVWSILLKYNPVGKVAVFGFMNPLFGVILSALLLGEKNQAFQLVGFFSLILVCIGIFVVNLSEKNSGKK